MISIGEARWSSISAGEVCVMEPLSASSSTRIGDRDELSVGGFGSLSELCKCMVEFCILGGSLPKDEGAYNVE